MVIGNYFIQADKYEEKGRGTKKLGLEKICGTISLKRSNSWNVISFFKHEYWYARKYIFQFTF